MRFAWSGGKHVFLLSCLTTLLLFGIASWYVAQGDLELVCPAALAFWVLGLQV